MIEVVLVFGLVNVVFEFVLLCMLAPRARLRVLGSDPACGALHFLMLGTNLAVHWGTVSGTMSSILAFCASLVTVSCAKRAFGVIKGRAYFPGWIRYDWKELT